MYALPPPFLSHGGAWGQPPPPLPVNPDFSLQGPLNIYSYLSNLISFNPHNNTYPTFPIQNPNIPIQDPNFIAPNQFPTPPSRPPNPKEQLERIDRAVEKARADLIAAGVGVSAWKVSQSAIRTLEVDCWSSLGFEMQQVPSLHRLMLTEGKINAFIHCFVGVRRITSLYDLEAAICKNEGIAQFEELGLGPFLRNPLVLHYFSVKGGDTTKVFKLTSEDIISLLSEFMDTCTHTYIRIEDFLDFIVTKQSVTSKEELGIRIHSLGMHISAIRFARDSEYASVNKSGELIGKETDTRCMNRPLRKQQDKQFPTSVRMEFCGKHIRFDSEDESTDDETNDVRSNRVKLSSDSVKSCDRVKSDDGLVVSPSFDQFISASQSTKSSDEMKGQDGLVASQSKGPPGSLKKQLDEGFNTISKCAESFFYVHKQFCGKHTRFCDAENSEDEGNDGVLYKEKDHSKDRATCIVNFVSQSCRSSDLVSSCPYPSEIEERERLGLDQLSPSTCSAKINKICEQVKKKRKSESLISATDVPPKLPKRDMVQQGVQPIKNGMQADNVKISDKSRVESWPPVDWRSAPKYDYACANGFTMPAPNPHSINALQNRANEGFVRQASISGNPERGSSNFGKRDRLSTCTPDAIQAKETGRLGELAAFKYFTEISGNSTVRWMNEHSETRLPYDIIIENEDAREFIEVKATRNPTKDWFEMSVRQLQFAVEQGDAFSVAHVVLSDNNNVATVRVYRNLEKLLLKQNNEQQQEDRDCKLKLVVMVLEQKKDFTIVS